MAYSVKEIIYTLQGEGVQSGRPAVFCRFSGCNLWSGREADRRSAICGFCDTDFVGVNGPGGGHFRTAFDFAEAVAGRWPIRESNNQRPFVVCTGGEPLMQLDQDAVDALHERGFEVAVETNGTLKPPRGIDWLCCSPKAGTELAIHSGDELKLVFPQQVLDPADFERLDFRHFFIQPMDGAEQARNVRLALAYCLENPRWRISLQTHKLLGIP